MEIRLLGPLEVLADDGHTPPVRGVRLQSLLVVLALQCGRAVSLDRLIDVLWADEPPLGAVNALQRHVSTLRRLLGAATVSRQDNGYALNLDESSVDAYRFEALHRRGRLAAADGDAARARDLFDAALALWRGDPLSALGDVPFVRSEITRLTDARLAALEARLDADLALGAHATIVSELEALVAEHPLREHFWAQLMLALARSGRQAEAVRAYQSARAVLGEELGLDPSEELRALETAILQQTDDLHAARVEPAPRRRTNVPAPITSLVGRGDELAAVDRSLETARLVTIHGPGGAGKTRLAIEAARRWHDSGRGDAWFVELATIDRPDAVIGAIAAPLRISEGADGDASLDRIAQFLDQRRMLLVLDNCEHVIERTAVVVRDLLTACASLHVLATSREPLGLTGEIARLLPPLPLDDAVVLFVERAEAVAPGALGDRTLVEHLCGDLDGLPLAIELAAARVRTMPVPTLAAELSDRFKVLTGGDRTALPRQQTLRATVDWSYELLFDDERRVFERLSVFAGGCSLDAARAVCADDDVTSDDVERVLDRLVDKSLVVARFAGTSRRYDMLQTLFQYARERLDDASDAARVVRAHTDFFTALCERGVAAQRGDHQQEWLSDLALDGENIRSALHRLVDHDRDTARAVTAALGWFWWLAGRSTEGAGWIARTGGWDADAPPIVRARRLAWGVYFSGGELSDGEVDALLDAAMATYRVAGALEELAEVASIVAITYSTRGNWQRARALVLEAESLLESLAPTARVAALHAWVSGRRALYEGRHADANALLLRSEALLRGQGDIALATFTAIYLARLALLRGEIEASASILEAGVDAARDLGLHGLADLLTTDLGDTLALSGDVQRGRELLVEARRAGCDQLFLPGHGGRQLIALALLERRAGNDAASVAAATEALDMVLAANNRDGIAQSLAVLGFLAEARGDIDDARAHHERGLAYAHESGEPQLLARALEGLAGVAARTGDGAAAGRLLGAAEALRRSVIWPTGWSIASGERADVERIRSLALGAAGEAAFSDAFDAGTADPDAVLAEVAAGR